MPILFNFIKTFVLVYIRLKQNDLQSFVPGSYK